MFGRNENKTDRIIRFILGLVLLFAGNAYFTGVTQVILYVLGAVALFTSITGYCLLYKIFGINTNK
jgi:hypothetical protein